MQAAVEKTLQGMSAARMVMLTVILWCLLLYSCMVQLCGVASGREIKKSEPSASFFAPTSLIEILPD